MDDVQPFLSVVERARRTPSLIVEIELLGELRAELGVDNAASLVVVGHLEVLRIHKQALDQTEKVNHKAVVEFNEASVESPHEVLLPGVRAEELDPVNC
jgi:hypothetical protein